MATEAASGPLRCLFDASLSAFDSDISRRPYHRNCGCALHHSASCSSSSSSSSRLSYPIHRSWVPLSMSASDLASSSSSFLPIFLAGEKDGFSGDRRIEGWMSKQ